MRPGWASTSTSGRRPGRAELGEISLVASDIVRFLPKHSWPIRRFMSIYRFAADAIVVVHAAYWPRSSSSAVIWSGRARLRWTRNFWFRIVHFLMIAFVAAEALGESSAR